MDDHHASGAQLGEKEKPGGSGKLAGLPRGYPPDLIQLRREQKA
jgi:hypothetical protein